MLVALFKQVPFPYAEEEGISRKYCFMRSWFSNKKSVFCNRRFAPNLAWDTLIREAIFCVKEQILGINLDF